MSYVLGGSKLMGHVIVFPRHLMSSRCTAGLHAWDEDNLVPMWQKQCSSLRYVRLVHAASVLSQCMTTSCTSRQCSVGRVCRVHRSVHTHSTASSVSAAVSKGSKLTEVSCVSWLRAVTGMGAVMLRCRRLQKVVKTRASLAVRGAESQATVTMVLTCSAQALQHRVSGFAGPATLVDPALVR